MQNPADDEKRGEQDQADTLRSGGGEHEWLAGGV
jgi:hypothetical protein